MQGQSMKDNINRRTLRTPDAANYLALSVSTLNKLRVFGGGPNYSKLGRVVVYSVEDLDAWLRANRRSSTSVAA